MKRPTASARKAAKAAGVDHHPVDRPPDPPAAQLAQQPADQPKAARLKHLGGSDRDEFNISLAETVLSASWIARPEDRSHMLGIVGYALAGIAPQDEVEGMLAGQMVAAHQASMECWRRAMIPSQPADHRDQNLAQANKASRTFAMLLEALNKHRGKGGEQRVVVEHRHVHLHQRDPAGDGSADTPGAGVQIENENQSYAKAALSYALQPSLRSEDEEQEPVPQSRDAKRSLPNARRHKSGRAEG